MERVVDANVLFSAAIEDSKTAELLLRDDVAYHAPEYLFDERERGRLASGGRPAGRDRSIDEAG